MTASTPAGGPLHGLRVLDLGRRPSTASCTRLLARFGATVFAWTPPASDDDPLLRSVDLHVRDVLLDGKQCVQEPLAAAHQRLAAVDLVVDDGSAQHEGVTARAKALGVVHCTISAYGADSTRDGNDLTAYAASGWAAINGLRGWPPLAAAGEHASHQAGTVAAIAIVAALLGRDSGKAHARIDVAERDVLAFTLAPALLRAAYTNENPNRRADVDFGTGPVPCRDGFFALPASRDHFWVEAMRVLGLPELADDPVLASPHTRGPHRERYVPPVHAALQQFDKLALFDALAARRVIAGPVLDFADLASNAHLRARDAFAPLGDAEVPGPPFRLHAEQPAPPSGAGSATQPSATANEWQIRPRGNAEDRRRRGPLAGWRGVVLTQAWAGSLATELLALFGADVIQVEPFTRLDSWRGDFSVPVLPALAEVATAQHSWNCNPLFNSVNLGKQSVTLDLQSAEGIALFRRLVAGADFVAENFSPRVLGKLGLDYPALRALQPSIVLLSLSGYGQRGPWSATPAIGGTIEPSSGLSALLGYRGEGPQNSGQMYPDALAGLNGALALVLALAERARSGGGQWIDLSMQEACLSFVAADYLRYRRTGELPGPLGNRHRLQTPHGIYPCSTVGSHDRDVGADDWIAIGCAGDAQFAALADVAQHPEWLARWPTVAARRADEDALDDALTAFTRTQHARELARNLADAGVYAAAVSTARDVLAEPRLRERGVLARITHPEAGEHLQVALPCVSNALGSELPSYAPLLGEHTAAVLGALGIGATELDDLAARGVCSIGTPVARRATTKTPA